MQRHGVQEDAEDQEKPSCGLWLWGKEGLEVGQEEQVQLVEHGEGEQSVKLEHQPHEKGLGLRELGQGEDEGRPQKTHYQRSQHQKGRL